MEDQEPSKLWARLGPRFFRKPKPPTPFETEAFVARVMGRVAEERAFGSPVRVWLRWLLPAAGLAAILAAAMPAADADLGLLAQGDVILGDLLRGGGAEAGGVLLGPEAP